MMKLNTKESMAQNWTGNDIKQIGEGNPVTHLHGFGGSSDGFSDIYQLVRDHNDYCGWIFRLGVLLPRLFQYSFLRKWILYYKLRKARYDQFAVLRHSMGGEMSLI